MKKINKALKKYIEENIFPKYDKFYSHGMIHINNVINNMLMLADYYNLDRNMAYTIASYHDSGLGVDRENHEFESGKIMINDEKLKNFFSDEQLEIMKKAIEDHRGSRKTRPRNFYGECISDSDRDFDIKLLAKRQIATSIKNYPELHGFDAHFERCYQYICKRINDKGKFNLWTNNPILVERRDKFQDEYLNKDYAKSIYQREWNKITQDGTYEKIINYYEDY
ncbi:MAG: HD domain-containing protein [Bacilli bacterium]|nr:HD domain-containing protein [Bacilli bacterium]